jgi:adenosine deaminase
LKLSDLHRHLDGSLRSSTIAEWAGGMPEDLRFHAGMGLGSALEKFAFTLSLLQSGDRVRRVASEICEDAANEGVTTLEIRFAPQLHLKGGARLEAIIDAAIEGANHRAGIILCGLYGDSPSLVDELVVAAKSRVGVVGIDLAGAPNQAGRVEDYVGPYRRARDAGIGRTVHAGEGRPADEIRRAIELLGAQRIGHGTSLLEDPALVDLILERRVTIEACPTSNVHTGAIPDPSAHPLPRWLAAGVSACINTDNTLLSNVDSPTEHARAAALPGMTPALLMRAIENGHLATFHR